MKHASGKFRMVFVNDLKDAQGNPKRAQLIGDDVYINVQHPDFESRVNYSRKTGKMQISERLCSYLANIAATAYKANIIQRSREGLQKYADSHFQLFDEILDLEFAIENQLRKYLPAIQSNQIQHIFFSHKYHVEMFKYLYVHVLTCARKN